MAATSAGGDGDTSIETKRVFLRANMDDPIKITTVRESYTDRSLPETLTVVHRQETYFGPKFTVEEPKSSGCSPHRGPSPEAIFWQRIDMEWTKAAEVSIEIGDDLPQVKVCLHCGEVDYDARRSAGIVFAHLRSMSYD